MPTDKPPFTFHMQNDDLEKMRYIAKKETRSLSNLLEHLCCAYIQKYEQEYGEIHLLQLPQSK
ncbi:MAG TPA: Arc family DNA-binding protein [Firmicutes bacterium]|nr:Arc family DNA-binding protein [Bacillota bacterium]